MTDLDMMIVLASQRRANGAVDVVADMALADALREAGRNRDADIYESPLGGFFPPIHPNLGFDSARPIEHAVEITRPGALIEDPRGGSWRSRTRGARFTMQGCDKYGLGKRVVILIEDDDFPKPRIYFSPAELAAAYPGRIEIRPVGTDSDEIARRPAAAAGLLAAGWPIAQPGEPS